MLLKTTPFRSHVAKMVLSLCVGFIARPGFAATLTVTNQNDEAIGSHFVDRTLGPTSYCSRTPSWHRRIGST
jgi:hypothetical protein